MARLSLICSAKLLGCSDCSASMNTALFTDYKVGVDIRVVSHALVKSSEIRSQLLH